MQRVRDTDPRWLVAMRRANGRCEAGDVGCDDSAAVVVLYRADEHDTENGADVVRVECGKCAYARARSLGIYLNHALAPLPRSTGTGTVGPRRIELGPR